jgi:hypothetical protein
MARYLPKMIAVEAFRLPDDRGYVVVPPDDAPRIVPAADFERVFYLEELRHWPASVSDDVRKLVEEPPALRGTPLVPDDLVPASEKLAATIAARTVPGGPGASPLPREQADVERILEETRVQVDQEQAERARNGGEGPADPKAGKPYGTKLKPGESAGRGRRVCVRKLESGELCNTVNPIAGRGGGNGAPCWGCGKPVKVAKR